MSEMVERAARAMFNVGRTDAHGGDIYEEQADWWREVARAAIEAMREPTEDMLYHSGDRRGYPYISYHQKLDTAGLWRSLIDKALKTESTESSTAPGEMIPT
jgi:hypothetical protein